MNQRKRIRFVFPELQRRLVALTLASVGAGIVVAICLSAMGLSALAAELPNDGDLVLSRASSMLVQQTIIAALVAVPTAIVLVLALTMPLSGALHRITRHVDRTLAGQQTEPCQLREGDPLQELCSMVNRLSRAQRKVNAGEPIGDQPEDSEERSAA